MLNRFTPLRHQYAPRTRHYLMDVVVEPSLQRCELGVQVPRPILRRADAEGAATFLETQTQGHEAFYEKLGFRTVHFSPREAEPLDVPVWRMIRPATSTSRHPTAAVVTSFGWACASLGSGRKDVRTASA
jgi:hypothetical protein